MSGNAAVVECSSRPSKFMKRLLTTRSLSLIVPRTIWLPTNMSGSIPTGIFAASKAALVGAKMVMEMFESVMFKRSKYMLPLKKLMNDVRFWIIMQSSSESPIAEWQNKI